MSRRAVAALTGVMLLMTGCSAGSVTESLLGAETQNPPNAGEFTRPPDPRCRDLFKEPAQPKPPKTVTVLLVDGSASNYNTAGSQQQDWAHELAAALPRTGEGLVEIGLFGGDVDWYVHKVTPGDSSDEARTRNDRADTTTCLTADLADVMRATPGKPQTDVLRALAEGAERVKAYPGDKTVVIATDGLSNTGCADLRGAAIGDPTAVDHIVAACKPELPELDGHFTVRFVGIGNSAAGWADVKTPQRTWLVDLWGALCAATKATCPEPASAAPGTVPATDVRQLADSDVTMPAVTVKPGSPTVISVPASILFNVDSSALASGRSQEAMEEVVRQLRELRPIRVLVQGHTDSTGTPQHNRELSKRRAEAVLAALQREGFENLAAQGYASSQPACAPEYNKKGEPDWRAMACNRRVEIVAYMTEEGTS